MMRLQKVDLVGLAVQLLGADWHRVVARRERRGHYSSRARSQINQVFDSPQYAALSTGSQPIDG